MRRPILSIAPLLLTVVTASAAEPNEVIKLWPATPPGPARDVGEEKDLTKPTDQLIAGRRIIKLANVSSPEAHVYLPKEGQRSGSTVVICPGGGYNILAWDLEGTEVAEWLNSFGVTAVVLKYRVPTGSVNPKWLQPVQDAQRTISIIRSRAKEWNLKPDQIGVLGFSAGGDTAARAAIGTERHYKVVDKHDETSCKADAAILIYPAYLTNPERTALNSDLVVTKDTPPAFLVHAWNDPVTPASSLLLALALKEQGVSAELHMYDAGGHGYGLRAVDELPVTSWPQRCEEWLRRRQWAQ